MAEWSDAAYEAFFRKVNGGRSPYPYQIEVARRLAAGQNVMLGAPTGAGKTLTVLTPFFYDGWHPRPCRLIYALPLRTLAQSIYREGRELARRVGLDPDSFVTMQTGEQPDDEFFTRGRIIITTYDQVLSGLLEGPYGLSPSQHNLNAAAVVGALVVFDEFHLMAPALAFLTGVAGLHVFRDLAQSVWMTATATARLRQELAEALQCADASPDEVAVGHLPTVAHVTRRLRYRAAPLTPEAVLAASGGRTIAICNTVRRCTPPCGPRCRPRCRVSCCTRASSNRIGPPRRRSSPRCWARDAPGGWCWWPRRWSRRASTSPATTSTPNSAQ